jgi:hypothetical protein
MATDFAPYANLRLLIPQPAEAPESLRDGLPVSRGAWVIEAFAKAEQGAGRDAPGPPSIDPSKRILAGYITAWATLPAETDWLAARSAFTWDETGLAPDGLMVGMSGPGFLGALPDLPALTGNPQQGEATIQGLSGTFGSGGIGAELRAVTGDAITVELQVVA